MSLDKVSRFCLIFMLVLIWTMLTTAFAWFMLHDILFNRDRIRTDIGIALAIALLPVYLLITCLPPCLMFKNNQSKIPIGEPTRGRNIVQLT